MSAPDREPTRDEKMLSISNCQYISLVFGPQNDRLMQLKHRKNLCALCLHVPLQADAEFEGSASWFVKKWETLLPRERERFRKFICSPEVLDLDALHDGHFDFCVDVRHDAKRHVIFYIDSRLENLATEFFQNVSQTSAKEQALCILHNPSSEYQAFLQRASGHQEEFMKDGEMSVWLDMLLDLSA